MIDSSLRYHQRAEPAEPTPALFRFISSMSSWLKRRMHTVSSRASQIRDSLRSVAD